MTANQINYYKAKQESKHWKRSDKEQQRHNEATEALTQYANVSTEQHYQRGDAINKAHYERADQASLINAQASSTQAAVAKAKQDMAYDLEYNYPVNVANLADDENLFYNALGTMPWTPAIKALEARNLWRTGSKTEKEAEKTAEEIKTQDYFKGFSNFGKGLQSTVGGLKTILHPLTILFSE